MIKPTASLAGAALLLALAGCEKKKEAPQADLPAANLQTATVHSTTLTDSLTIPAHVDADPDGARAHLPAARRPHLRDESDPRPGSS